MASGWQRIVHSAHFRQLLKLPQRWRSAHFAIHHVHAEPAPVLMAVGRRARAELSTDVDEQLKQPVDDLTALTAHQPTTPGHWWAAVVPKRHARRAVTRNLVDRQVLAALQRAQDRLSPGMWLLRLRSPWPRDQFRSADSEALRAAVREELDTLLARCSSLPTATSSASCTASR
jgi:ribonuclease P protein component